MALPVGALISRYNKLGGAEAFKLV